MSRDTDKMSRDTDKMSRDIDKMSRDIDKTSRDTDVQLLSLERNSISLQEIMSRTVFVKYRGGGGHFNLLFDSIKLPLSI